MKNLEKNELLENKSLLNEEWELIDIPFIRRNYKFESFQDAMKFVNLVAEISEELNHHPEIFISNNILNLNIYTHDTNTLTDLDFKLAQKIDEIGLTTLESPEINHELVENINILKNGSDFEKRKAAVKLGKIRDSKAVPILIKSLNDKDGFVRRAAARSLGKIKDERAIKPLIRILGFVDGEFRYAAKDSLVEIGESSETELVSALGSKNYHQREMAVEALSELGSKNSLQYLKQGLLDEESKVRWRAARAINQWYDDDIIILLKNISKKDPDRKVRDEAIKSLGTITDQIQKIYETFLKSMKFLGEDIEIRSIKSGESFAFNNKIFCSSFPHNATKIHIRVYKGNVLIKGVKNMKDPKWGIIYLQREEELSPTLEIVKESYLIAKRDYK